MTLMVLEIFWQFLSVVVHVVQKHGNGALTWTKNSKGTASSAPNNRTWNMDHFRCDVQRRNLGGIHLLRNTLYHLALHPICTGSLHPCFWLISIRHVQSLRWNSEEALSSHQTIPTGPGWKWRQHLHCVPWQGRKHSHIAVRTWQVLSRLRPQMPECGGFRPKVSRVSRSHRACLEISLSFVDKCRSNHFDLCG